MLQMLGQFARFDLGKSFFQNKDVWSLVLEKLPPVSEHIAQHIELLECIAAGDSEAAARLTAQHVTDFEKLIRAVL